jgi:hypothetical protein
MHVSPPDAMDKVAAAIAGDMDNMRARIEAAFEGIEQPDQAAGITPQDVIEAVILAIDNAECTKPVNM